MTLPLDEAWDRWTGGMYQPGMDCWCGKPMFLWRLITMFTGSRIYVCGWCGTVSRPTPPPDR
jgi:hypothetical protein